MAYSDYNKNKGNYSSGGSNAGSQPSRTPAYGKEKKIMFSADWITNGITDDAITFAEGFGEHLKNANFTSSQIRNVFGEIKRIQMNGFDKPESKTSFLLLKPKMAYAARRAQEKEKDKTKWTGANYFEEVMRFSHEAVKAKTPNDGFRFGNFCDFMEAILAYHRAEGGRDF